MLLQWISATLGAASSVVNSPIRHVVVEHSGELGVPVVSTHVHSTPCSSTALAEYAVQLALGPAAQPKCSPRPGQGLWQEMPKTLPQILAKFNDGAEAAEVVWTPAQQHSVTQNSSLGVHFVHLYVVQSTQEWCPHPCMSPSWELAAPKPEPDSPYLLLEAAIWRQSRRVTLYRFDPDWENRARASYNELCEGRSWGCLAYDRFRESRSLLSVGPWPVEADSDPHLLSAFLRDAFSRVFDEVHKLAGPQAHVGLTYSGHGGLADGSLFAGALKPHDSVAVLQHATSGNRSSGKLSLLNFAGNCLEGRWNMLEAMHPFSDWVLASDLEVGGLAVNASRSSAIVEAMSHLQDVAILKGAAEKRVAPREAVKQVVNARFQLWDGEQRSDIAHQRLRQSLSGFEAANFPAFQKASSTAFRAMSGDTSLIFGNYVEDASCDVLVALRLLDTSLTDNASPSNATVSLVRRQDRIKLDESGPLELQFRALRPFYASTKPLFTWETETNGLSFNVLHHKCDFTTAFGESPSPSAFTFPALGERMSA